MTFLFCVPCQWSVLTLKQRRRHKTQAKTYKQCYLKLVLGELLPLLEKKKKKKKERKKPMVKRQAVGLLLRQFFPDRTYIVI